MSSQNAVIDTGTDKYWRPEFMDGEKMMICLMMKFVKINV